MKKSKTYKLLAEDAKEREKRWKELHGFLERHTVSRPNYMIDTKLPVEKPKQSAENDVDRVLKSIGLEKYVKLMRYHGIEDLESFKEISEETLDKMGIVLGHRLKLLRKIKDLKEDETIKDQPNINSEPSPDDYKKYFSRKVSLTHHEMKSYSSTILGTKPKRMPIKGLPKDLHTNPNKYKGRSKELLANTMTYKSINSDKQISISLKGTNKGLQLKNAPVKRPPIEILNFLAKLDKNKPKEVESKEIQVNISDEMQSIKTGKSLKLYSHSKETEKHTDLACQTPINFYFPEMKALASTARLAKVVIDETEKTSIAFTSKPPLSTKQLASIKRFSLQQPATEESPHKRKQEPKPSSKWDKSAYIPYKPSEEIQAAILKVPLPRPHSATNSIEINSATMPTPKSSEKFEVAGW